MMTTVTQRSIVSERVTLLPESGLATAKIPTFLDKFSSRDLELKEKWDQLIRLCSLFSNRLSLSRQIERGMQKLSYFFVLFELKNFEQH